MVLAFGVGINICAPIDLSRVFDHSVLQNMELGRVKHMLRLPGNTHLCGLFCMLQVDSSAFFTMRLYEVPRLREDHSCCFCSSLTYSLRSFSLL